MSRTLTSHIVNPANDKLTITVMDEPGPGGANHRYRISGYDDTMNPAASVNDQPGTLNIVFQNGPINEVGVNGITHEALLAILIDRLEGFQRGKFSSIHNEAALDGLKSVQRILHNRTRERMERGVEGTHKL